MRRFACFGALFCLLVGLFPVLPAGPFIPVALAAAGDPCASTKIGSGSIFDPHTTTGAIGQSPTDGLLASVAPAGNAGGNICNAPDASPPPWCLAWGGAPFGQPRADLEDGTPVVNPGSIATTGWTALLFSAMEERTYLSLLSSAGPNKALGGVNITSLAWGFGYGDVVREALGIRLDSSGNPVLALNSGGTTAAQGIWNGFRAEFAASGAGPVQNPAPSDIRESAYILKWVQLPNSIPQSDKTTYFAHSSLSGVQRIWMAHGTFYQSSSSTSAPAAAWFGNVQKVVRSQVITATRTMVVGYTGLTISQASNLAAQQGLTTRFNPLLSAKNSTWRVTSSSPTAGQSIAIRGTIVLNIAAPRLDAKGNPPPVPPTPPAPPAPLSQVVQWVTVDPMAVVGGMNYYGTDGKTAYTLAAPVVGQDLTKSDPGGAFLPVGSTVSGYATSAKAAGLLEPNAGIVAGGGLPPPVEAYVRWPTYQTDPNTGLYVFTGNYSTARIVAGSASTQHMVVNFQLMASARVYWNSRPADQPAIASVNDYISSVHSQLDAVVATQNSHRWDSTSASFDWANNGNRGVAGVSDVAYYSRVYYPVMMSPYTAGGSHTAGTLAAARAICGSEIQQFGPNVQIQPGGQPSFLRAMTQDTRCNMSTVTTIGAVPDLSPCWFSWYPFQLAAPKCDPEICLFMVQNYMQWFKLDHTGVYNNSGPAGPPTQAFEDPTIYRQIDAPATVGQDYFVGPAANGGAMTIGIASGDQPVPYFNYAAISARYDKGGIALGGGIYLGATQVGVSYEIGNVATGSGRILTVYPKGSTTGTQYISRDLANGKDPSSLVVSFRFDETPLSYLQSHPECALLSAKLLLTTCGIGYDPGTSTYFYQVRIRTWWDVMWGDDPALYPSAIVAFGLLWMGINTAGSPFWSVDPAAIAAAIRPFANTNFSTSLLTHYYDPANPAIFAQTTPKYNATWGCFTSFLGCPLLPPTQPPGVIKQTVPIKKPGWGKFDNGNWWGYAEYPDSFRPLIDTSIFCGETKGGYVTGDTGGPNTVNKYAACLINIPVLQGQKTP